MSFKILKIHKIICTLRSSPKSAKAFNSGLTISKVIASNTPNYIENLKGLRALRPFFGPRLRSKYESGNKRISLHDFIRLIFLVFHFGFNLNLAVHLVCKIGC